MDGPNQMRRYFGRTLSRGGTAPLAPIRVPKAAFKKTVAALQLVAAFLTTALENLEGGIKNHLFIGVSASPCVFIVKWGETFFANFHLTINTPAHLQTGKSFSSPASNLPRQA
jgi:hypothetical protein